ncbi:MAG: UDP-N-acetylmuramyl-tripeptide synthetase [Myxococcota bacterium]
MSLVRPTPPPFAWADPFFTFGVTGTNGKTSTVHLIASAIAAAGHVPLRLSTVDYRLGEVDLDLPHTRQGFFDAFEAARDAGTRWASVEVTSRALADHYAKRWRFDLGVFTNLSPDHLSTHGTYEHYLAAKAQLFVHLGPGQTAVLNAADEHALFIDAAVPADVQRCWFASPTRGPLLREADLVAASVDVDASGTRVTLASSPLADALGGSLCVRMVGAVFAENALAAAAAGVRAGLDPSAVRTGLASCPPVAGRFEVLGTDPIVVVDYAHTPDALERTCAQARTLARGKLLVVFGAGGGASGDKRGPMGAAVAAHADRIWITNDNPRDEDPAAIAGMLEAGCAGGRANVCVLLDRADAIEAAMEAAQAGDVVVVAGKGHERGQTIAGKTAPFSDRDEVRRWTTS